MTPMKKTSHRSYNPFRATHALSLLLLSSILLFPLATQAGFWDSALKFGKNLLATAAGNYTNNYQQDLTQLLQALRQPRTNQPPIQGTTAGNPYDPHNDQGYTNNPYEQQEYSQNPYGQQGYPNDPYTQQGYPDDPRNQQGYANDPYARQGQQEYPGDAYEQHPGQPSYSNDPNGQQEYPSDPYAQQGYPQDPYGQEEYPNDPYTQQGYPDDPRNQQSYANDPHAQQGQQGYPEDPSNQQGYANDAYTQQEYTQLPNARAEYSGQEGAVGIPIELDVAIVKKTQRNGTEILIPIKDGDVLKDGRGNAQAGDKFRIMFRANCACYIYVIAIDGSAWAQGIFPNLTSPFANPVKQDQQYVIPENNNWLSLDQFKGIETLFFVASPEKRQDIEDIVANIAGKERHPKSTPQQVTEAPIIPSGYYRSQSGSSPFIIGQGAAIPLGQDHNLIPTTYFTQKAGEALRVTRWFRHE